MLMAFVLTRVSTMFGIRHHLLVYGTDPGWTYSEMNGFGPYLGPLVWFKLYWAAWALLLGVIASLLWVRGRETGLRHRLLEARARFAGDEIKATVIVFPNDVLPTSISRTCWLADARRRKYAIDWS